MKQERTDNKGESRVYALLTRSQIELEMFLRNPFDRSAFNCSPIIELSSLVTCFISNSFYPKGTETRYLVSDIIYRFLQETNLYQLPVNGQQRRSKDAHLHKATPWSFLATAEKEISRLFCGFLIGAPCSLHNCFNRL